LKERVATYRTWSSRDHYSKGKDSEHGFREHLDSDEVDEVKSGDCELRVVGYIKGMRDLPSAIVGFTAKLSDLWSVRTPARRS